MTITTLRPVVLLATDPAHSLANVLHEDLYAVLRVPTGTLALEWARDLRPDTIILDADLPDMSGASACRLLHGDLRIGRHVPILILTTDKPTPDERVAALRAGAWDVIRRPRKAEDLSLTLQTYVQAKRNIDLALADGLVDPATGLHSRPGLARRARELGALMARERGALACVVFAVETEFADPATGNALVRSARVSDVVGALSATEFGVLAPATDPGGVVGLARRLGAVLAAACGATITAGFDAVTNFKYSPIDPIDLLTRATMAVKSGKPEPDHPWLRRFDGTRPSGPHVGPAGRAASSGSSSSPEGGGS